MPDSGEIDVAHVARLARLNLTEEETRLFQGQLRRVLEYAEKLKQATAGAAGETPAATVNAPSNVLREDEPHPWFTAEEALSNAPRQANDLFVVPKVVE